VLPGEFKVRLSMIKTLRIEYDQGVFPSLMLSVACFTLRGVNPSMKAPLVFHIRFGLFMAGQAFVKEPFLSKGVTVQTFTFVFLMEARDLARHHPFEDIQGIGDLPGSQEQD
jgi:hypothetical protein